MALTDWSDWIFVLSSAKVVQVKEFCWHFFPVALQKKILRNCFCTSFALLLHYLHIPDNIVDFILFFPFFLIFIKLPHYALISGDCWDFCPTFFFFFSSSMVWSWMIESILVQYKPGDFNEACNIVAVFNCSVPCLWSKIQLNEQWSINLLSMFITHCHRIDHLDHG